jgi:hypothetical protein
MRGGDRVQGEALPKNFGGGRYAGKRKCACADGRFQQVVLPRIENFPRNYKFLFGDRLVEIQLDR